jgi:hypothetical protein
MISEDEFKKTILRKIRTLNEFIRQIEDFCKAHGLNPEDEKIYSIACAQRKFFRDLIGEIKAS